MTEHSVAQYEQFVIYFAAKVHQIHLNLDSDIGTCHAEVTSATATSLQ